MYAMYDPQVGASDYQTAFTSQITPPVPSPIGPIDVHHYLTAGLGQAVHRQYIDNRSFVGAIRSQMSSLGAGRGGHYVILSPVTKYQLSRIDKVRDDRYKQLRFMYLNQPQVLIVRIIPDGVSEIAARELGRIIWKKTAAMGLNDDLVDTGSMRYQCIMGSKEADAAFKPKSSRPSESNWPTLVIECGVPKSIERMRSDANWWLKSSSPGVNIVLLLSISHVKKTIHVEQWERVGLTYWHSTEPNPDDFVTTLVQSAYIDAAQSVAPASPMTLDFAKLFLRQPVPFTSEGNIALTMLDLEHCAGQIWSSLQQEII